MIDADGALPPPPQAARKRATVTAEMEVLNFIMVVPFEGRLRFFAETYNHDISEDSQRKPYKGNAGSFVSFGPIIDTATKATLTEFACRISASPPLTICTQEIHQHCQRTTVQASLRRSKIRTGAFAARSAEVEKLNNVTIYTFPILVPGPDSATKATAIWCAKTSPPPGQVS